VVINVNVILQFK